MATETLKYVYDAETNKFTNNVNKAKTSASGLEKQADSAGASAVGLGEKMQGAGTKISNTGLKMTATGGIIAGAIGLITKSFLSLESGVQVFEKVFEDGSAKVLQFYEDNRDSITLTIDEYKNLAGQVGDTIKPFGVLGDELDSLTTETLQSAIALSQWKGVPVQQATEAVTKALLGERESLKTLGIAISDAEVKERALADTGKATADALTQQEKATATLALVTEKGSDALENFGNLDRIQKLQVFFSKLKEVVFEAISNVIIPVIDKLQPKLDEFAEKLEDEKFQKFVTTLLAIGAGVGAFLIIVGPLLTVFGTLLTVFGTFSTIGASVFGVFKTLGASITGLFAPLSKFTGIFGVIGGAVAPIAIAIGAIVLVISFLIALGPELKEAFNSVFDEEKIQEFKDQFAGIKDTITAIFEAFKSGDFESLGALFEDLGTKVSEIFSNIVETFIELLQTIDWGSVFEKTFEIFTNIIVSAWEFIKSFITETDWGGLLADLFNALGEIFQNAVDALINFITETDWTNVLNELILFFGKVFENVIDFILGVDWLAVLKRLVTFFIELPLKLIKALIEIDWISVLVTLGTALKNLAVKLFEGLKEIDWSAVGTSIWNAIKNAISGIGQYISDLASSALSAINPFDMAIQDFVSGLNLSPIGNEGSFEKGNTYQEFNYNFGRDGTSLSNLSRIASRLQAVNGG